MAVVTGHLVLISLQVNTASGVRMVESVTLTAYSEIQRAVTGAVDGLVGLWDGYVALQSVQAENEALRKDLADLQLRWQRERAVAQRVSQLEELLGLRRDLPFSTVTARVIAHDATPYFRTVTINLGSGDGVRRDSAVVSPAGVVGRVVSAPGPRSAKVQLLVDRSAAAGALIERTRVPGIVKGDAGGTRLLMDFVEFLDDVVPGDVVVTSGTEGIYPKGWFIGDVEEVERGSGLYLAIDVRPRVEFDYLEDVLVIVHEPTASKQASGGK